MCWRTGIEKSCTNSSYFHCNQSLKCIPYHRVGDGTTDCYYQEDESFDTYQLNDSNRFICESDSNKCLPPVVLGNGYDDCLLGEDEAYAYARNPVKLIPFSVLCNRYYDYKVLSINSTETDETNCEWWPCNNPYTRCDEYWHCMNGADELNCPNSQCSLNEHECEAELSGLSYCLPLVYIFDKYLDNCSDPLTSRQIYFYNETKNSSDDYLSWNNSKCLTSDEICGNPNYLSISKAQSKVCFHVSSQPYWMYTTSVHLIQNAENICYLKSKWHDFVISALFLTATRFGYLPSITTNYSIPIISKHKHDRKIIPKINVTLVSYCHRGIAVLIGINGTKTCLCPPNYFGAQCQWQNQRVSLTLQLLWRSTASITVIFQVVIMLIDENGQIAPNSEQINYMPSRDCDTKFNIYLLYPDRPKNLSSNYSIRIDLFEKTNLDYWSNWYLPIPFPFLPVNRIATQYPSIFKTM